MTAASNSTPLFDDIKQQLTVARFYSKLLSEVLQLKATSVVFRQEGETLVGILFSGEREIKSLKLSGAWLGPIRRFVLARPSLLGAVPEDVADDAREFVSSALVRIPGRVVEFRVTQEDRLKDGLRVVLDEFRPQTVHALLERFGFSRERAQELEQLSEGGRGVCVFAAPTNSSQRELRALLEGVLAGVCIDEKDWGSEAAALAAEGLVFAMQQGSDIDATRSFAYHAAKALPNLVALGCGSMIARVCDRCARVTVPERRLLDQIPSILQPLSFSRYRVGLGCDECENAGTLGRVFIGTIVKVEPSDAKLLASSEATPILRQRGAVSLIEDGIKKATSGLTTIEDVLTICPSVPSHHHAMIKTPLVKREPNLNIGEDFFVASPQQAPLEPLRGRAALRGPAEDSTALFPEAITSGTRVSRTKPLIMIVEDDPDQRSILEMIFKSSDYDVSLARDGQEALDFLAQEVPDLVISDLMMPRVDGGELVRRMKADRRYARVPVLMLTVVSDVEKEYQLLDLGADDYCEKTIQRKILLKRVANLLKRSA